MTRCALYRHYDADGVLLYVGISVHPLYRIDQHSIAAHWYGQVANIGVEWFDSREAAMAAERLAVTNERPAHNKHFARDDRNPVSAILSCWPDRRSIAADLSIEVVVVHRWFQRGAIPSGYWLGLLASANERGISVTADDLVIAHAEATQ